MDKYELLLHDLKEIVSSVNEVNKVSHGKAQVLQTEDTFTSVYLVPTADRFMQESHGASASSYDNIVFIRLIVNMDCRDDELLWVKTRRKLIDVVLDDSPLWNTVVNRDLVSIAHDDYDAYPLKSMEILFEFRLREECVI